MDPQTKTTTTKVDQQTEVQLHEQARDDTTESKQKSLDIATAQYKDDSTKNTSPKEKAEELTAAATTTSSTSTKDSTPEVVTSSENEHDSAGESDQEAETTSSSSATNNITNNCNSTTAQELQEQEENEEPSQQAEEETLSDVRRLIAGGLCELTHQERNQIEEEVHGVINLGVSLDGPEPHLQALYLKKFQEIIDMVLSGSMSLPKTSTAAYELCLQKNYMYATNESEEVRLMCLRAELWDPSRACERFLHHLTALLKYYGEYGLSKPMTIDQLDREENDIKNKSAASNVSNNKGARKQSKKRKQIVEPRGIYKKGKGGSKRKGSLDSLPDMLALKSGFVQVLPSRDRSGRRVVVLQPAPSTATSQQTQKQVHYSKFKAMVYFFTALLRRDVEAQQKGFVLILNATKSEEQHNESDYGSELLQDYQELVRFIPIRICALHFAFDKHSLESIPHKISRTILESYIENNPKMNYARVHLYDRDVSNDSTKLEISPYGIPTHQIPLTHTGTIKLKEHNGWVKIQEWYDKMSEHHQHHYLQSKFNVIECPSTNDVLFSQGGKYWNGVNRFQRGNLEFMEYLESKIDLYQSTLSWKKKHTILAAVVAEFAQTPQSTGTRARFLETATQIEGVVAPDGCWVELPLTSPLLMQKIRQTLLNHIRRLESSGKRRPAPSKATRSKKSKKESKTNEGTSLPTPEASKAQTISGETQPGKTKKRIKITEEVGPNKKRKMDLGPSVMKNNKLAMATFGNSINNNAAINNETSLLHKQAMCEFLANAERIAVSTAAVDIACENYDNDSIESNLHEGGSLQDAISNDEKLVQAIIANDDRLNKEVGELFDMDSFLKDEEELGGDVERDEIADCLMGCML